MSLSYGKVVYKLKSYYYYYYIIIPAAVVVVNIKVCRCKDPLNYQNLLKLLLLTLYQTEIAMTRFILSLHKAKKKHHLKKA